MTEYFKELGMGIFFFNYLFIPLLSILIGVLSQVVIKKIWVGALITFLVSLIFYFWYSVAIIEEGISPLLSLLPIIFIHTIICFMSSVVVKLMFQKKDVYTK
jgi:hypothetical protein